MDKAKHAYGSRKNLPNAIAEGIVDSYDVLFLNGEDESPAIGWVDKDGNPVIVEQTDISGIEDELATKATVAEVDEKLAAKADTTEVDSKISQAVSDTVTTAKAYTDGKVEAAISEHLTKKYEITDAPAGTLVKMNENEIRICCPANSEWSLQSVGKGGDANTYYVTLKTYIYNDNAVGYIEHLGDFVDAEILTDLKTDEYGRRYQPTWLGVAKYDETADIWTYYGANSSEDKYVGWDYQLDLFDADGVMIASDSIRINLSNEDCHSSIEPYYVNNVVKEAKTYTDEQIEAKIAEMGKIEVIEF